MAESLHHLEFAPFAELSLLPDFGSHHDIYQSALAPDTVIRDIWGPGTQYRAEDVDEVVGWKKMMDHLGEHYGIMTPGHHPVMTAEGPMIVTRFVTGTVLDKAITENPQARVVADDLLVRHIQMLEDLYDYGGYSYGDVYGMYQYMIDEQEKALLVDLDLGGWYFTQPGYEDKAAEIEVFDNLLRVAQDIAELAALGSGRASKEKILAFIARTSSNFPAICRAKKVIEEGIGKADQEIIHSFAVSDEEDDWIHFWEEQPYKNILNLGKYERQNAREENE